MRFWRKRPTAATFLGQLRRDVRGNTMAIMAAALIPMIAMVGSGVDMTRAYMAQNRMSQACDAGSLAGRRLLAGTNVTDEIRSETTKYFQFNFRREDFQANPYTLTITAPQTGTLHVETATTIPTTLMKFFGFQTLDIKASCSATQDFVNTDIAMVLDVSGSMNCTPSDTSNSDCNGIEATGSKIQALRDAAIAFYDALQPAQDQLHANSLRLRYGFVNYSSAVNVGKVLYDKNPDYLVSTAKYQSRWGTSPVDAGTIGINNSSDCYNAYTLDSYASAYGYTGVAGGYWGRSSLGAQRTFNRPGGCLVFGQTSSDPDGYTYGLSNSQNVTAYLGTINSGTYDASFYLGTPDGTEQPNPILTRWSGCIEERKTDSNAINNSTSNTAPASAWDLDVDRVPNSTDGDDSRWRPMWPEMEYWPETKPSSLPSGYIWNGSAWESSASYYGRVLARTHPTAYCPSASRKLLEYYNDRAGFVSYINSLRAQGSTYHDLGIIWGARFLSPDGIFKSATPVTNNVNDPDNPTKIRGFSVKKYMIFMTDGQMAPSPLIYSSYGVEALDGRVIGSPSFDSNVETTRHLQRFRMACNAAKSKGIDIWVVAFGTSLTTDMTNCASKPEQAASVADRATLVAKFQEIGSKIGSLRLSQ